MLEQIKKIARQSDECAAPAMVLYGTVTGLDPLRVRVDNRFELGERALTLLFRKKTGLTPAEWRKQAG